MAISENISDGNKSTYHGAPRRSPPFGWSTEFKCTCQQRKQQVIDKQKIEDEKQKLVHQHKMISSDEAASNLSKEMVKYTEQKARYTDNLLSVYSVLNIVALGLLVYVFRSTTE